MQCATARWWSLRLEYDIIWPMTYELIVLVAPSVDVTNEKAQGDLVKKILPENVTLNSVASLGKKQLAYAIKKQTEATYLVAELAGRVVSADVEKKAKLDDRILRVLLTIKE